MDNHTVIIIIYVTNFLFSSQGELEELLENLDNTEGGVEGLEVDEDFNLPPATPLLTQWGWRQVTVPPQETAQLCSEDWFGLAPTLTQTETGKF